ncbi:MAG: ribose-phosphate diphosphokinase [Haloarculaceae archaeon]
MIVAGSRSQALAAELAAVTDHDLATVRYEEFPDGETLVEVDPAGCAAGVDGASDGADADGAGDCADADGAGDGADADGTRDHIDADVEDAVVVAATTAGSAHVELLQLQDAVRELGAETITTVLPYMGYARQDEVFETGQPLSARAVAKAISTGTDRVVVVNPHVERITDFFTVPATSVSAADRLAEPLPGDLQDPLFLSPDEGAVDLARDVRDAYSAGETDFFQKTRHSGAAVEIEPSDADVADRDVVVTDDIVATGTTMCESIGVLTHRGARRVIVACVHPMLVGNARLKLATAGVDRVVGTDTIEREVSAVSVAPTLAEEV